MVSTAGVASINAEQTEEAWLVLMVISHPSLAQPIRVVNNPVNITSGGNVYLAAAFNVTLPDDGESVPVVTLEIDNVDRGIMDAARAISTPPTCSIFVVISSTPNTIEAGPFDMTMSDVNYSAAKISATLIYEDLLNEPFPAPSFNAVLFPGLF